MAIFHTKKVSKKDATSHLNWMGGNSWDISNPIMRLRIAASSCFFGEPQYYHQDADDKRPRRAPSYGGYRRHSLSATELAHLKDTLNSISPESWRDLSPSSMMEKAIDEAIAFNVEQTLQEAVRLRSEDNIRTTPQVILVRAAHSKEARGTGFVRKYAKGIIQRADEPSVGLAYHKHAFGKTVPNSLKKAWRDALENFSEYQLAKYRMENKAVKTVDVMNVVHPKSEAVNKLAKGELKTTGETWESIISAEGSSKESWTKAIDKMGHMALLRNIRNFNQNGIDPDAFVKKLKDTAAKGRQLPFRYVSAYNANAGAPAKVIDAIEDCLEISLGELPQFKGKVMSLCDNSGSAWGAMTSSMGTMPVATIANLTGILTAKVADEGHIGAFGDRLKTMEVRKKSSVFDELRKFEKNCAGSRGHLVGGGTEHGIWLFWDKAIKQKEHWDHVFVYSDMQAGHGGLYGTRGYEDYIWPGRAGYGVGYIDVPKLVKEYRKKVNPDVKVYLVQVAGYQDTIIPEWYDNTYILGGWGDGLLRFAASMAEVQDAIKAQKAQAKGKKQ